MRYSFSRDNNNIIQHTFSKGYEIFGYWLVCNYQHDISELSRLLSYCEKLKADTMDDYQVSENSFYLQLTQRSAKLVGLSTLEAPADQSDNKIDFDNPIESEISLEELQKLLLDWQSFTRSGVSV